MTNVLNFVPLESSWGAPKGSHTTEPTGPRTKQTAIRSKGPPGTHLTVLPDGFVWETYVYASRASESNSTYVFCRALTRSASHTSDNLGQELTSEPMMPRRESRLDWVDES